jgi:hypothetical protein
MCANLYTQGKFTQVITMTSRKDAGKSLIEFTDDVGIPERLITDRATEFTGPHMEFVKEAWCMRIMLHTTEQGRKNQNHAAERERLDSYQSIGNSGQPRKRYQKDFGILDLYMKANYYQEWHKAMIEALDTRL